MDWDMLIIPAVWAWLLFAIFAIELRRKEAIHEGEGTLGDIQEMFEAIERRQALLARLRDGKL